MGMFDNVRCHAPLPDDRFPPGSNFQTKSLYCVLDEFTITAQGRLIHHLCRYEPDEDTEIRPGVYIPYHRRVAVGDIDMDYHGDIKFYELTKDHTLVDYVARFTHGALEWIRPFDKLPEIHKTWFHSKD